MRDADAPTRRARVASYVIAAHTSPSARTAFAALRRLAEAPRGVRLDDAQTRGNLRKIVCQARLARSRRRVPRAAAPAARRRAAATRRQRPRRARGMTTSIARRRRASRPSRSRGVLFAVAKSTRDAHITAIKKSHRMTNFAIRRDEGATFR